MNTPRPFAWSYSRLKNYETCPKRHYHYDIARDIAEPQTPQLSEGNATHKAFENRVRHGTRLPLPLLQHEAIMEKLAAAPGQVYAEQKLALTVEFKPVDYFGKGVWFRTVLDYCNISNGIASVIDYKTGRPSPDPTQSGLMAATIMHYDQTIEKVRSLLLFINHNHTERVDYTRAGLPAIWSQILPRVAKLQMAVETQEYPPNPGGLCRRYCAVISCPYHGRGTQ